MQTTSHWLLMEISIRLWKWMIADDGAGAAAVSKAKGLRNWLSSSNDASCSNSRNNRNGSNPVDALDGAYSHRYFSTNLIHYQTNPNERPEKRSLKEAKAHSNGSNEWTNLKRQIHLRSTTVFVETYKCSLCPITQCYKHHFWNRTVRKSLCSHASKFQMAKNNSTSNNSYIQLTIHEVAS